MTNTMNFTSCKNEARFDNSKAAKIWKRLALCESRLDILRSLKSKDIGTGRVEEFILDIRGQKHGKISKENRYPYPEGGTQGHNQQNTKKSQKIKQKQNHKINKNQNEKHIVRNIMQEKILDGEKGVRRVKQQQTRIRRQMRRLVKEKSKCEKIEIFLLE